MNYLFFNGVSSKDFGLYISGSGTFDAPQRDVESVEVPGKTGDLHIDKGRYRNINVSYPAFIRTNFSANAEAARAWLLSHTSYARLEDTYHPEEYRMARFVGPIEWNMRALNYSGECSLLFDCKPQRFLKSGEYQTTLTAAGALYNPSPFPAKPQLRIYGTSAGTVSVGSTVMRIKAIDQYVDIDCETENAFKGLQNCNGNIYAPAFPVLQGGQTQISFSGGITKIEITPRWWTI